MARQPFLFAFYTIARRLAFTISILIRSIFTIFLNLLNYTAIVLLGNMTDNQPYFRRSKRFNSAEEAQTYFAQLAQNPMQYMKAVDTDVYNEAFQCIVDNLSDAQRSEVFDAIEKRKTIYQERIEAGETVENADLARRLLKIPYLDFFYPSASSRELT